MPAGLASQSPSTPTLSAEGAKGLSEQEAARRLRARGRPPRRRSSRSYASIVRASVLTVFNAILAAFGALTLCGFTIRAQGPAESAPPEPGPTESAS